MQRNKSNTLRMRVSFLQKDEFLNHREGQKGYGDFGV